MDDRDTLAKTFAEFADTFGVKLASAKARARRGKWPKTMGSDGRLRGQVPRAVLLAADGDAGDDMVGTFTGLECFRYYREHCRYTFERLGARGWILIFCVGCHTKKVSLTINEWKQAPA